ncbi:hypothetical protein [Campylobacter cuniculorum]|uniref:Uncharacterized protein n=2 Tax=Campylobacter cuniculorum TaxID=374106 RepID=A0A1W6BYH5_9BACT|nr:hypothetical protein [Campylobacter cuniculorum]ARJ57138.1 hypothetical protein CCUN_1555 [Campylobacter cuniculorum DSM 23162 = LMG 24588]QOR04581.1 hypothetical protein A0071_01110 [Campylobacter cuniculorum]
MEALQNNEALNEKLIQKEQSSYQKIKDEILSEDKKRSQRDKINKEMLNQLRIIEAKEAELKKEKEKLTRLKEKKDKL